MKNFVSDKEIVRHILNDLKWARDARKNKTDDWLRFYRLYKNYLDRAKYIYSANLAIPTAYSNIEVQVAFILSMIFEGGDFVEVLGKTPQGQISATAIKEMMNYHFRHSFRTYEDMEKFIRQLLMYGTSIYKVYWDYRIGWKRRYITEYKDRDVHRIVPKDTEEEIANQPAGYVLDLWNFFVDPHARDVAHARYAGEEMWLDANEIISKTRHGGPFSKRKNEVAKLLGMDDDDVMEGLDEKLQEIDIDQHLMNPHVERGKFHCIDYWGYITKGWEAGKAPNTKDKTLLIHAVIHVGRGYSPSDETATILLLEPAPFHHAEIPYVDARINACVDEFYGTGDIELCESLYLEQRDMRNAAMENLNLSIHQMWGVRDGANIDESELRRRPGGIYHFKQPDDVVSLPNQPVDPAVFQSQEDIRRDIEQVTGVNDFVMGQYRSATGFNDTATGISLIQQTALMRLGQKGQVVQRAIRDIARQAHALIAQFQPFGTTIRMLDRENAMRQRFMNISPEELAREYDFHIVNSPALGSKALRQNQLIQLYQITMQAAGSPGGMPPLAEKIFKRIIEEMEVPNADELYGFPDFNAQIPAQMGEGDAAMRETINPEEENRLMIDQHQVIQPKMGETHPQHLYIHDEGYNSTEDREARDILATHMQIHQSLMEQEKAILSTIMAADMQAGRAQDAIQQQMAMSGENMLGTKNRKSPTAAPGGQEDVSRAMGNMLAGNV